jgi:tripartite-type tricarboxylate transporter receptor subunit TctC
MNPRLRHARRLAAALLATFVALPALADTYPSRPIRVIVPYPAGGSADVMPRTLGPRMSEELGQQLVFENKPGASGTIGLSQVAAAKPDGYTLGASAPGSVTVFPHLAKLAFDPLKDLAPIAMITTAPHAVVVNADLPVRTTRELIEYVKARPGTVNFGSSGPTSLARLSTEIFNRATGLAAVHVAYQGSSPTAAALASGEVQYGVPDLGSMLPQIKAGKIRALAVTTPGRSSVMPELPTMSEAGINDFLITAWIGLFAPAGTPPEIIDRLNAAAVKALGFPEVRERLIALGGDPSPGRPEAFARQIREDSAKYAAIIKEVGVTSER